MPPRGPAHRPLVGPVTTDPDRNVVLDRRGPEQRLFDRVVAPLVFKRLAGAQSGNDIQTLVQQVRSRSCVRWQAEMPEVRLARIAHAVPEDEAAMRQVIESDDLPTDFARPATRHLCDHGPDLHTAR